MQASMLLMLLKCCILVRLIYKVHILFTIPHILYSFPTSSKMIQKDIKNT